MLERLWGRRFLRVDGDPLRAALGTLERPVMEIVWGAEHVTVRDVQSRLDRPVAYTTVMTTLDRLYKKGFVARTRSGRAFVYRATGSRAQAEAAVASGVVAGLLSTGAAMPILSNLVDAVGTQEDALDLLTALEAMVREKRRRLERDGDDE